MSGALKRHNELMTAAEEDGRQFLSDKDYRTLTKEYKGVYGINDEPMPFLHWYLSPSSWTLPHLLREICMVHAVLHRLDVEKTAWRPLNLLDVGCGTGDVARMLSAVRFAKGTDWHYTGLEMDLRKVHAFQADSLARSKRVTIEICDVRKEWPFPFGRFSGIFAGEIIEHMTKRQGVKFLREAHRVAEVAGWMALTTPVAGARKEMGHFHEHEWEPKELRAAAERAGWRVDDEFYIGVPRRKLDDKDWADHRVPSWLMRAVMGAASGQPGSTIVMVLQKEH